MIQGSAGSGTPHARRPIMRLSLCGKFYVLDALFLDRDVGASLARWCEQAGCRPQDGIQFAVMRLTNPGREPDHPNIATAEPTS